MIKRLCAALLALLLCLPAALADTVSSKNYSKYIDFFKASDTLVKIPGLDEGYVPQGMCALPGERLLVISAYHAEKPSLLFFVDTGTGECVKRLTITSLDGTLYKGHAGGVAAGHHSLFVASDKLARRIDLSAALAAPDGGTAPVADVILTDTRASLACVADGVLWVGDFYAAGGKYPTQSAHHMKTPSGDFHCAWAVGYILDQDAPNEINPARVGADGIVAPDYVLSLPDKVQGMTRLDDGRFVLSISYGRNNASALSVYENVLAEEPHAFVTVGGVETPLWYLDQAKLQKSCKAPTMAEAVDTADGALYLLFESGAQTYSNGACPLTSVYEIKQENIPY